MSLGGLAAQLARHRLAVMGGFHPGVEDATPEGTGTLLLLGPAEPGFWAHVAQEPEFADMAPNPLDRWSRRVIDGVAREIDALALYPFGGPPWLPFIAWAKRTGRCWDSPVGLLVHDTAGLFVSFRGALALRAQIELPPPAACPCERCPAQPCRTACPVAALTPRGYDVPACRNFIATTEGQVCRDTGCAVRRACPVSQGHGRRPEQSAFHMRAFAR